MEAPASKRQRPWLAFVPIALLIGLAYSNSLQGELFYDNRPTILEDPRIRDVSGADEIFGTTYWYGKRSTLYRPLTTTSYLVNYALLGSGPAPFTYHLVNLLLHVATAALLFALTLPLLRSTFAAALAAILFGLHPIATEAVSNVVGRADQLAAFGVLAGLLLHVRAATGGSRWWRLAAQLPYAIALFSKESGSVLLALALATDVLLLWPPGADPASRLRTFAAVEWRRLLPYAVTFALYLAARQMVVAGIELGPVDYRDNPLVLTTGIGRLAGVVKVFGLQLARLFFPWTLSGDYSYAQIPSVTTPLDPLLLTGLFGLISLVILALVFARRAPVATFGLTFFFVALLPVSNLLFL